MSQHEIRTITPVVLRSSIDRPAEFCVGNPCVVCSRDNPDCMILEHPGDFVHYIVTIGKRDLLRMHEVVRLSKCSELRYIKGFEPESFHVASIQEVSYVLIAVVSLKGTSLFNRCLRLVDVEENKDE